ncbi:MAG: hypothetical protein ACNA8L_12625 [Luteolibacter sp.]
MSDFIDHWLQSVETGREFEQCTKCACQLEATGEPWIVNKEWHRSECVMEYALCHHCRGDMQASISAESLEFVQKFFEEHIDPMRWLEQIGGNDDPASLIESCFACGQSRESAEAFGISAMFTAQGTLEIGPLPVMICQECSAKVEAGLSKQTRESWRRFVDENFPGPPGLDEPIPHRMPAMF